MANNKKSNETTATTETITETNAPTTTETATDETARHQTEAAKQARKDAHVNLKNFRDTGLEFLAALKDEAGNLSESAKKVFARFEAAGAKVVTVRVSSVEGLRVKLAEATNKIDAALKAGVTTTDGVAALQLLMVDRANIEKKIAKAEAADASDETSNAGE